MDDNEWTDERYWNACFGPYETRESVLAECERENVTPQDYAMSCVIEMELQCMDYEERCAFDRADAFRSLCKQLGVHEG